MCNFQELSLKGKDVPFSSLSPASWNAHTMAGARAAILDHKSSDDSNKLRRVQAPDAEIARPAPGCLTPDFLNVREKQTSILLKPLFYWVFCQLTAEPKSS